MPPNQAKILRLGVIHGGKIVDERLLRKRQPVIVGESTKSTIVLPPSANVGLSFRLFDTTADGYQLAFTDQMEGCVSQEEGVCDFAALKAKGLAKKKSDHYAVTLDDQSRGKVVLGDVTLLFQFVSPPPEAPKTVLPKEVRHTVWYAIDWWFAFYFTLIAVFYLSAALYLRTIPIPDEDTLAEVPDRFAKMLMPDKKDIKEPEKPSDEKKPDVAKKEEKKEEKPIEKKEDMSDEQLATRKKQIQKQVGNKGVLAILGTLGKANGAVADVFSEGKAVNGDIDSAFKGIGGIEVANGGNTSARGGKGAGNASSIGGLETSGGGKVGLGEKAEQRVGNVQASAPEVDGGALDPGAIARVVKSRLSAVKECYEHELKRNPKLAGKVVIRFSIDEDGRVANATVDESTIGDTEVGACIVSRFEHFRFPKPDGGTVTATFPFIFTPSS